MKKETISIILTFIILPLAFAAGNQNQGGNGDPASQVIGYPQITEQFCDTSNPCPEGLECYAFPTYSLKCAEPDPCNYWNCPPGTECVLAESYPSKVMCRRICISSEDCTETTDSYTTNIGEMSIIRNQQQETAQIRIHAKESEEGGILESSQYAVSYENKLRLRESKLYMETSAGEKEISILPEEAIAVTETLPTAVSLVNKDEFKTIELIEEDQKPVYSIKRERERKLFGFIPTKMQIQTKVSAENGELLSEEKPWWSFLAS